MSELTTTTVEGMDRVLYTICCTGVRETKRAEYQGGKLKVTRFRGVLGKIVGDEQMMTEITRSG